MGRLLRYVPPGGALVEVSNRTLQGRPLLRPSAATNELILGVLGQAHRLFPVDICAMTWLSTHFHMLLHVPDARRLSAFMGHVESNVAREIGCLVDWPEKFWAGRFHSSPVSDEERAQVGRLEYVLANGVKENLVAECRRWPGVQSVSAILDSEPLCGVWFDRVKEYPARRRGKAFDRLDYATEYTIELAPLPCWAHLSRDEYRERVRGVVEGIEARAREEREASGSTLLGVRAILGKDPTERPKRLMSSPQPPFHAATKAAWKALREAYNQFVAAYREAARRLAEGERDVRFPEGSFPPPMPFVEASPPRFTPSLSGCPP